MTKSAWFASWFDSPYYHLLYNDRDDKEAFGFIDRLIKHLAPAKGAHVLDLACGKGRHARRLAAHELDVIGIDLSENSIKSASQFQQNNLNFHVHDMRQVFKEEHFDYIFNFFTSFGYFDSEKDNQDSIVAIAEGLKPAGTFVIDFMNAKKTLAKLTPRETKTRDGLDFHISKTYTGRHIVKKIAFVDKGVKHEYEEVVQALMLEDFKNYFKVAGLEIVQLFGDYDLRPFDEKTADRLIIQAVKA